MENLKISHVDSKVVDDIINMLDKKTESRIHSLFNEEKYTNTWEL